MHGATSTDLDQRARLDLRGQPLGAVPDSLRGAVWLKHLSLSQTGLTRIPDWLWELRQLESLNLSENTLTSISDGVAPLTASSSATTTSARRLSWLLRFAVR
ncbi:MAG TPA: leucine-rich repeat domain-containing protein [Chloroflexota bacterium]|jgi:Leucine-rich repeat (LRR) protein